MVARLRRTWLEGCRAKHGSWAADDDHNRTEFYANMTVVGQMLFGGSTRSENSPGVCCLNEIGGIYDRSSSSTV